MMSAMTTVNRKLLLLLIAISCCLIGNAHADRLYKWKDENGIVRYGDRVPPRYAKQGIKVLNEQGVVVEEIEGQKTAEQLAAEKARLEREAAFRREVEARRQYDRNLLETYSSVREIEIERDRQVSAVDAQITQANRQIRLLQSKITRLELEAQSYTGSQGSGPSVPDNLVQEMTDTRGALDEYEAQLRGFYVSQADLRLKFNGDMVRFRELKRAGN